MKVQGQVNGRNVGKLLQTSASPTSAQSPIIRRRTNGSSRRLKNFPRALRAHLEVLSETTPVKIWFGDEVRIGEKNG